MNFLGRDVTIDIHSGEENDLEKYGKVLFTFEKCIAHMLLMNIYLNVKRNKLFAYKLA